MLWGKCWDFGLSRVCDISMDETGECICILDVGEEGGFKHCGLFVLTFLLKLAKGNRTRDLFISRLFAI